MAPTTPAASPAVAGEIVVSRGPGGFPLTIEVDGAPFPYAIDGDHGVGIHLAGGDLMGAISVTIPARVVRVDDEAGLAAAD